MPFGFEPRTRLAGWAMRQTKGFAALVAPWLAQPGDLRMRVATLALVLIVFAAGVSALGYTVVLAVREVLPSAQRGPLP